MIQRYDIDRSDCYGNCGAGVQKSAVGSFMLYADHVAALAQAVEVTDAQVEAVRRVVEPLQHCGCAPCTNEEMKALARDALAAARAITTPETL